MEAVSGYVALLVIILVVKKVFSLAAKQTAKENRNDAAETIPEEASPLTPKSATRSARKRAQMAQTEVWRAAKRQQDDAEQIHSINMDSCESKLQSLRVLYEAGILDREEYAQRVARVRAMHAHGAEE